MQEYVFKKRTEKKLLPLVDETKKFKESSIQEKLEKLSKHELSKRVERLERFQLFLGDNVANISLLESIEDRESQSQATETEEDEEEILLELNRIQAEEVNYYITIINIIVGNYYILRNDFFELINLNYVNSLKPNFPKFLLLHFLQLKKTSLLIKKVINS